MKNQEKFNSGNGSQDSGWDTFYRDQAINDGMSTAMRFQEEKAKAEEARNAVDSEELDWYKNHPDRIGDLIDGEDPEKLQWYREHPDKIDQLLTEKNRHKIEVVSVDDDKDQTDTTGDSVAVNEIVGGAGDDQSVSGADVAVDTGKIINNANENQPVLDSDAVVNVESSENEPDDGQLLPEDENGLVDAIEVTDNNLVKEDKYAQKARLEKAARDEKRENLTEEDKDRLEAKLEKAVQEGKMTPEHAQELAARQLGRYSLHDKFTVGTPEELKAYHEWLEKHDEENMKNLDKPERKTKVINVAYGEDGSIKKDVAKDVIDSLGARIENGDLSDEDRVRIAEYLVKGMDVAIGKKADNEKFDGTSAKITDEQVNKIDESLEEYADRKAAETIANKEIEGKEKDEIEEKEKAEIEEKNKTETEEKDKSETEENDKSNSHEKSRKSIRERIASINNRLKEIFAGRSKAVRELEEVDRRIDEIKKAGLAAAEANEKSGDVDNSAEQMSAEKIDEEINKIRELAIARKYNKELKAVDAERADLIKEIEALKNSNNPDDMEKLKNLREKAEEKHAKALELRDKVNSYIHSAEDYERINRFEA